MAFNFMGYHNVSLADIATLFAFVDEIYEPNTRAERLRTTQIVIGTRKLRFDNCDLQQAHDVIYGDGIPSEFIDARNDMGRAEEAAEMANMTLQDMMSLVSDDALPWRHRSTPSEIQSLLEEAAEKIGDARSMMYELTEALQQVFAEMGAPDA